jgi:hypothetical protein
MEAIAFIAGAVVIVGGYWSVVDLMNECGINPGRYLKAGLKGRALAFKNSFQASSDFRSRDISSSTACRAGFSQ